MIFKIKDLDFDKLKIGARLFFGKNPIPHIKVKAFVEPAYNNIINVYIPVTHGPIRFYNYNTLVLRTRYKNVKIYKEDLIDTSK